MGRLTTFRQTTPFKNFRKVMNQKINKGTLEYPCAKCIVEVCCITACEEFEMWLEQSLKHREPHGKNHLD